MRRQQQLQVQSQHAEQKVKQLNANYDADVGQFGTASIQTGTGEAEQEQEDDTAAAAVSSIADELAVEHAQMTELLRTRDAILLRTLLLVLQVQMRSFNSIYLYQYIVHLNYSPLACVSV